ncbi:MAG: phosphatase PAP2 family protein [Clostridia bacterium]|nr:phosphatase PAP2 family protein [Clostridia bacterium]
MMGFFYGFDHEILSFYHTLAEKGAKFFTPLAKFITLLGEKGILLLIAAVVLMCFAKTRKLGVCLFGAVCCGALITNIILKDLIGRPRPFEMMESDFRSWWLFIGAPPESDFSFPSGHATAAAAGMAALALAWNKKSLLGGVPYVILMCASRNYLMHHYPTDVLAGCGVGLFSAIVAFGITLLIFGLLEKYKDKKLARLLLYDIDAAKLIARLSKKKNGQGTGGTGS